MTNWIDLLVTLVWPTAGVLVVLYFGDQLKALINRLRSVGPSGAEWFPQQPPPAGDPASSSPVTDWPVDPPACGRPDELRRSPRDYVAPVYRPLFDQRLEVARSALAATAGHFSVSREEILLGAVADMTATLHLERASRSIFRSQVEALELLRRETEVLTRSSFRPFYMRAAQVFPVAYANYNFDQWFTFLVGNGLVVEEGETVTITQVGHVIGHYMAERGYAMTITY